MPDAKTHGRIGAAAGGVATLLATNELPPEARLAATIGGIFGGYAGGKLPDVLEPAISSWHRSGCHSVAAGTGVVALGVQASAAFKNDLLKQAAELRVTRLSLPNNHPEYLPLLLREFATYMAYGALIGFTAGYASHLVLDGGTDRGIPLIAQGLI